MIETIKRIIKNIKWAVFNHPPTNMTLMTREQSLKAPCSYCGSYVDLINYADNWMSRFCICWSCLKKIYDKALLPKKTKKRKTK